MSPMISPQKRPSFLKWSEIQKWTSTASLLRFKNIPEDWHLLKVSDFATLIDNKEPVEPDKKYPMAGVRWYGEGVFHRETVLGKDQSANYLSPLKQKAVIYNRLFAWKESFAVVTKECNDLYVSNEFPQFEIDDQIALPEYIYLLFITKRLIKVVNASSVGSSAVSRNRFKEDDFLDLKVPIPPLSVQKKIVAYWEKTLKSFFKLKINIEDTRKNAIKSFRTSLGLKSDPISSRPKLFLANWKRVDRWGIDLAWQGKTEQTDFSYPIKSLIHVCRTGSGGTPSRKHKEYYGGDILWVKTTEVQNKLIDDTGEKITQIGLDYSSAKLYPAGSIVVAMYGQGATRGRTAKLGVNAATNQACLVLTEIDKSLDTDFLWYYLMVSYDEMRQLASGNNQPNLSAELLGSFPVPIPPLEVQKKMNKLYENAQMKIARLESKKKNLHQQTVKEIEKLIIGTLSVEGL